MSNRKKRNSPKSYNPQQPRNSIAEYSSAGEECQLSTSRLTSGLPYQRPVAEKEVNRLVREWDVRLLEPLTVSFRDGKFYLIDGQHRASAMRKMNGNADVMVPCRVFSGMTYADEAKLCYQLDKAKRRLSLAQATNALVESGDDPQSIEIKRLLGEAGFIWALGKQHESDHEIVATRAVIGAYELLGGSAFARMLALLDATWHGDPHSLSAAMLSGVALFLHTYGPDFKDASFIKRLSAVAPEEILRRSKTDFSTSSKALRVGHVLLEKYNAPRGGHKLTYRFQR